MDNEKKRNSINNRTRSSSDLSNDILLSVHSKQYTMSKIKWYASVNRSNNAGKGTMIRLKEGKHVNVLAFIEHKQKEIEEFRISNPETCPLFILGKKDWDKLGSELKAGFKTGFVRLFEGMKKEFCILCEEAMKGQIYDMEMLRVAADKQKKLDEEKAKKEEEEKDGEL